MGNDLIEAIDNGDIENVERLIDQGANYNIQDRYGNTVLIDASRGYLDIVRLLLNAGALPNIQNNFGNTALILASYHGYIEIVRLLLTANADPNLQNNFGDTALIIALDGGYTDIVNLLERSIDTIRIQSRFRGRRTRKKIRTLKAKQRSSLAKLQDSIQGMTGQDVDPDIYIKLSGLISDMAYNPEVNRRMLDEQDDPYTRMATR